MRDALRKNVPSPVNYHKEQYSAFFSPKKKEECHFGLSYSQLKKCDIDNKQIIEQLSFDTVGPLSYEQEVQPVKKRTAAYSLSGRFPHISEVYKAKEKRPGPADHEVNDQLVKSTRFAKPHAGGYSPRYYLNLNKNPGPGDYENPNSIADLTNKRSGRLSSNFASKTGSSWYSKTKT